MKTRRHVELTFTAPAKPRKDDKKQPYDGGFHIQTPKKRENCGASKRSSVQSFTFR